MTDPDGGPDPERHSRPPDRGDGPSPGHGRDGGPDSARLRRTRGSVLVAAALVGALIGWTVAAVSGRDGVPVRVAWSGPVTLLAAAAVVVCISVVLHQRLHVQRRPIDARQAVAWLALAKAGALVGVLMAGGYAGFAVRFLTALETEAARQRVIRSAVAIVGGIAFTLAALRIERSLEVPGGDEEDDQSSER